MTIPDEAVEAAAQALAAIADPWGNWDDQTFSYRRTYRRHARQIIEAAAPHFDEKAYHSGWGDGWRSRYRAEKTRPTT